MQKRLPLILCFLFLLSVSSMSAQTNEWATHYVTLDEAGNGTGDRTASVAVTGANAFVALVTRLESSNLFSNLTNNYLVAYVDADSALGRTADQAYSPTQDFTSWISGLDEVALSGAWQIASDTKNRVYVANNGLNHNILVFELSPLALLSTDFRMETGAENIFAIEVDTAGYVYVVDYEGSDSKTNEVKVYAPIGAAGTTWGDFSGHNDTPTTTIDLPPGKYQGVTVSGNGSQLFISATSARSIWKYSGDPVNGYTRDDGFTAVLSPDDTVANGGSGTPGFLGLAYDDSLSIVYAAADTFLHGGSSGGYPYGRVYVISGQSGAIADTIDVAEWNNAQTGSYSSGSSNGRVGGFTSVYDVDTSDEPAVYTQTYYGWAVEKWLFDGDLGIIVSVRQISEAIPQRFTLAQNYPNPFNPATTIAFDVQAASHVILSVYNMLGQKVATLVDEHLVPGSYTATFKGGHLPSGIYFYSLEAGAFRATKKLVLAK
ncbi:MAG: T9SS type A sorting domain-containing protein [bacterium]